MRGINGRSRWGVILLGAVLFGTATAQAAVMLVSDTTNGRVLQYEVDGTSVTFNKVFTQGTLAGVALASPMGMTVGRDGWVYIGEQKDAGRILRFAPDGTFLDVVAASGTAGFAGGRPESVETGPDGRIYVTCAFGTNTNRVFKIDVGQASLPVTEFITASGVGYGSLNAPRGLSFGPDGHAYLSDRGNNRILKFDGSSGAYLGRFDTSGAPTTPQDLSWHQGDLYVSSGNSVRRYTADGAFADSYTAGGGASFNIGLGAFDSALYSVNWSESKVYQRVAPGPAVAVAPAGGEPSPAISGPGHVLFSDSPLKVAVAATVADAHVNLSNGTNYGGLNRLRVGSQGGGDDTGQHEGFLRFDLSSIPAGATVQSVMFRAVQTDGAVGTGFRAYEVTSAWDETTISGTNRPTVAASALGDMVVRSNAAPYGGASTFQNAGLTQLAQDWIGGHKGSHGLNLKMINPADGDTLASRENASGHAAPQLVVLYENAGIYTQTVQATGPLGYYRFSEVAGSVSRDSADQPGSPNRGSQDGTFNAVALAQPGPGPQTAPLDFPGLETINRSARFNGTSSRVSLGYQIRNELAALQPGAISVEAWVNKDDLSGTEFIAGTRINGGGAGAEMAFYDSTLRMAGRSSPSDSFQQANIDFLAAGGSAGEWHHLVGILDYPRDQIRLYVDGLLAGAQNVTFASNSYTVGASMTEPDSIGSSPNGGYLFQGLLDEVAFYAFALDDPNGDGLRTDSRVWAHYTAATLPEPQSLGLLALGAIGAGCLRRSRKRR